MKIATKQDIINLSKTHKRSFPKDVYEAFKISPAVMEQLEEVKQWQDGTFYYISEQASK